MIVCLYRVSAEVAAGLELIRPIEFMTVLFFCFTLEILKSYTTWRITFLAVKVLLEGKRIIVLS